MNRQIFYHRGPARRSRTMLYFAAATTYERRRAECGFEPCHLYLRADDAAFRQIVERFFVRLALQAAPAAEFERDIAAALRPYNIAGLCDSSVHNMYRHTAAPWRD